MIFISYSPLDLLTNVTDAQGNLTSIQYDTLGRKTAMSDPDMGNWSYAYNVNGTLASQTDARGVTTTFAYDALDRLTDKYYSDGTPQAAYRYDESWASNGIGRRTSQCRWNGSSCVAWEGTLRYARAGDLARPDGCRGVAEPGLQLRQRRSRHADHLS